MINLLPREAKDTLHSVGKIHSINRIALLYLILLACIALLYIAGLFLLSMQRSGLEDSVRTQESTLTELGPILQRADSVEERIELAKDIFESEIRFSVLVQEIGSVLPAGTSINQLTLGEDIETPLMLQVFATNYSEQLASTVQANLIDSNLFVGADIQSVSLGANDAGANSGSISLTVQLNADEEREVVIPQDQVVEQTPPPATEPGTDFVDQAETEDNESIEEEDEPEIADQEQTVDQDEALDLDQGVSDESSTEGLLQ